MPGQKTGMLKLVQPGRVKKTGMLKLVQPGRVMKNRECLNWYSQAGVTVGQIPAAGIHYVPDGADLPLKDPPPLQGEGRGGDGLKGEELEQRKMSGSE